MYLLGFCLCLFSGFVWLRGCCLWLWVLLALLVGIVGWQLLLFCECGLFVLVYVCLLAIWCSGVGWLVRCLDLWDVFTSRFNVVVSWVFRFAFLVDFCTCCISAWFTFG